MRGEAGGDGWGMERGQTDYIPLVFASKVIHSCHCFLATAPLSVHGDHSGGNDPSNVRKADAHVTS